MTDKRDRLVFLPAERRQEEDRREAEETGQQTPPPDRKERRGGDRRAMRYSFVYKTSRSLEALTEWLEENTTGDWTMVLCGIDGSLKKKSVKIMFELEEDRLRLKQMITDIREQIGLPEAGAFRTTPPSQ